MHASKDEQMIAIGGRMNESLSHLYSIRIFFTYSMYENNNVYNYMLGTFAFILKHWQFV